MGDISYAEGFNSGGVSVATIANVRTFFPFEPSTLKNYEVCLRSDFAGGRVRFNATVFHTIWEDIQALGAVNDPVTGVQLPTLPDQTSARRRPTALSSSSRSCRSRAS